MASIFAIGSFFTSCKKDHINSMNEDKFSLMSQSLEKPFLIISEFDDYEAIMEEPEGTPISIIPNNFISLKDILDDIELAKTRDSTGNAYFNHTNIADTIFEDYGRLLDVLNEDKIIQLNEHLVKIDLHKDSAFVINANIENAYQLLSMNLQNDSLASYPTDMEVGLLLFNLLTCKEKFAKKGKNKTYDTNCTKHYKTKNKIVYQRAAIYFSLVAKAKNLQRHWYSLGIWHRWGCGAPNMHIAMKYKPRCKPEQSWWEGNARDWYWAHLNFSENQYGATFRPYASIVGLHAYDFSASLTSCCGANVFLKIKDGY